MKTNRQRGVLGFCLRVIAGASRIVPARWRGLWREEWESEITLRWQRWQEWNRANRRNRMRLLKRTLGAVADAVWLRQQFTFNLDVLQDVRFGLRQLRKNPGFTTVAVLTLALGIGATTAMFSVVRGVLLRPLPYPESDRLVEIRPYWNESVFGTITPRAYLGIRERTRSFEAVGLNRFTSFNLIQGDGEPERVLVSRVSPGTLAAVRARPQLGRAFLPEEETWGEHRVILLSDRLWKSRFGGDHKILGRTLTVSETPLEIVGVMPAGFDYPSEEVDIWISYGLDPEQIDNRGGNSSVLARLGEGTTIDSAQAELDSLSAQFRQEMPNRYPEATGVRFVARPLIDVRVGSVRPALLLLLGAVAFVLLIACANVANLLLARMTARKREIAVRSALGASRARIARQILAESLLISLLGALAAFPLASLALDALTRSYAGGIPRMGDVRLDLMVLAFTAGTVFVATLMVGLIPLFRLSEWASPRDLREGRSGDGAPRQRIRSILVVSEVALATVLLLGAGLLVRSYRNLLSVDPGFRADHVLAFELSLPERYRDFDRRTTFYRSLLWDLESQPGIVSAGIVNFLPMAGLRDDYPLGADGYVPPNPDVPESIERRIVSAGYFDTLGIPVLRGRAFSEQDTAASQPVVILSASLAKHYWGDGDPIGRRVRPGGLDSDEPWHTVVGVVGDVHHDGMREGDVPIWYKTIYQQSFLWMTVAVRTAGEPAEAVDLVKQTVHGLDPNQPIFNVRTLSDAAAATTTGDRLNSRLLSTFAVLALGLAGLGVFGVLSYSVNRRVHEIGIRRALGGTTSGILALVMGEGLRLIAAGLGMGVLASLGLTRLMASLLFGVEPADPLTFALTAIVLLGCGAAAAFFPAWKAARVDPMVALRYE